MSTSEDLKLTASGLIEGQAYMFRVAAENKIGVGEFVDLNRSTTPKNQFGKQGLNGVYIRRIIHLHTNILEVEILRIKFILWSSLYY